MKIIYALILSISLSFGLEISAQQMELAKAAGISESTIQNEVSKARVKEATSSEIKKENKEVLNDIKENKTSSPTTKVLKRYASYFFNNKNKINPYSIPTPTNYKVSYSDQISLTIYGAVNENFKLKVDNNGNITIPKIGEKKVIGLSFNDTKKMIMEEIKIAYPNSTNILVDMSEFSSIQIIVSGLVKNPGLINLSTFSTIKDAIIQSGGILENGSYRNILLKRNGKIKKVFDLYSFVRYGNITSDTTLQNGDIIFVNSTAKQIDLSGDVNYPSIFELKKTENFRDLIKFASGLKASANKNAIKLKRYEKNTQKVYTISLQDLYEMTPKDGDEVHVFSKSTISAKYVLLKGNVIAPGEKEIPKDKYLSTLLKNELKQFGKDSYFLKGTSFNFATITNDRKIKTFNLQNILDGKEDIKLKVWDEIEIIENPDKKFIKVSGDVLDDKNTYKYFEGLKLSDLFEIVEFKNEIETQVDRSLVHISRIIDKKINTFIVKKENFNTFKILPYDEIKFFNYSSLNDTYEAIIKGEIFLPGKYNITKATTLNDIINLSGGFTKKALKSRFEIARYYIENNERKRKIISEDLSSALNQNLIIQADDEITIFPISNWGENKYVTINGLVKFPGSYPIEEGEKLSNVIKRAGGFLSTAFIEASVFTREEVRILQEKRLSQSLDKLRNQVVKASTNAEKVGESKEDAEKKLLAIKQLETDAKNNRPIGRVSLNLYHDINRFKNSQYDITLKDKDTLYVPSISDTVSVVGEVLNQNTFIYDSELNTQDYLAKAGGPTELANEDYIYIIKANGETLKYEEKFFWGNKKEIFKGDTIIVPMEYDMFSDMKFVKDISSILYQFAITAASLKTVGGI